MALPTPVPAPVTIAILERSATMLSSIYGYVDRRDASEGGNGKDILLAHAQLSARILPERLRAP
jgi:hypothetical protein